MPTRCNRGLYCRSYCLLNMFRASLCPSSRTQEYCTVVAACGISCCGFSSSWSGVELRVMRILCPSSGAQEYYTVVAACGISCCGFSSCWSGVELRVMCPVCSILQTGHITLSSPHKAHNTTVPTHDVTQRLLRILCSW